MTTVLLLFVSWGLGVFAGYYFARAKLRYALRQIRARKSR